MTKEVETQTDDGSAIPMPAARELAVSVRVKRFIGTRTIFARRFKDAWILIDRDTQADDNAEHLYRYMRRHHPHINAWFVLRKTSNDWPRLKREGFRLLSFGSFQHRIALLHARHIVSSQCLAYVTNFLPKRNYTDLIQSDFTYLRHGVAQHDQSQNLNPKPIDRMIVSATREYNDICSNDSPYRYTERHIVLTGLPRHDYLFNNRRRESHRRILIMPTWRASLAGAVKDKQGRLAKNSNFVRSEFFQRWAAFMQSPQLADLASKYNHEVSFFPHPELRPYVNDFASTSMSVIDPMEIDSVQDVLLSSSVMITDFSSIAFEMAYIERPVIYYQFDDDFMFNGGHIFRRGYFDYKQDGFGPVADNVSDLLRALESVLCNDTKASEPYAHRMREFFAFRDGQCCARTFDAINNTPKNTISTSAPHQ